MASAKACHELSSQNEQNQCMQNVFEKSQKTLDVLYQNLTQDYFLQNEAFVKNYKDWIEWRKQHCEARMQEWGGSGGTFTYFSCLDRLTKAKVAEWQAILSYVPQ